MNKAELPVLVCPVIPVMRSMATLRLRADQVGAGWERPACVNVSKTHLFHFFKNISCAKIILKSVIIIKSSVI